MDVTHDEHGYVNAGITMRCNLDGDRGMGAKLIYLMNRRLERQKRAISHHMSVNVYGDYHA